ncbi:MAG: S46 family peptidase, partial [Lentimicrobium sp.]|nr:S46 family peptidase [Lentimicrobium sp.]
DKQLIEAEFADWVKASPDRGQKYGNVLGDIASAYENIGKYTLQRWYFIESIVRGAEVISLSQSFSGLAAELKADEPSEEKIAKMKENLAKGIEKHFKNYNLPTDRKLLVAMLQMYYENVPAEQQPLAFRELVSKNKGDFNRIADNIFSKSIFADKTKVDAFLVKPSLKVLEKDPAYSLMKIMMDKYRENQKLMDASNESLDRGNRLFVAGLREMKPDQIFYPNANSTMRLTYGKILDYYPADAVHYNHYTTMKGIMEKEDPDNWEFVVPAKLKELYEKKDFGIYAMSNGEMPVAFLSTTDITGGNSGSPVLNANGELIGLAFDGNWEAMSGDIAFEPALQRTISVDIRYVLFIIDKYAGAKNIINELTLAPKPRVKAKVETEKAIIEADVLN